MQHPVSIQGQIVALSVALALSAACSSTPAPNEDFAQARTAMQEMRAVKDVNQAAGVQVSDANAAFDQAESAWKAGKDDETIEYLSAIATSKANEAAAVAKKRIAQERIENSSSERSKLLLQAQEREAAKANAKRQLVRRENKALKAELASAKRSAATARLEAAMLTKEMEELEAKQSDRGMVVTLDGVLFESGSAILKSGADRKLQTVAKVLLDQPDAKVLIEGFTDSTGSTVSNQELSERRSEAVRRDLMLRGIASGRIQARGLGESFPVASNDTPAGRQQNRRVELIISDSAGGIRSR